MDIFSSCGDQSSEIIEHQERLLWLFVVVSAPSNCSAVGVLVDFSSVVCILSQLSTGRNAFVDFLSPDGFRKVIALENGIITAEKSSVIEFQHPFFKQGKAHLLENIKRKV